MATSVYQPGQERASWFLPAATIAMLLASLYLIFVWVPNEMTMGVVQRIFYIHLPSAFTGFVAFYVGGVASVLYLLKREDRYDDLSASANEVGLVFTVVNLVTGILWAKPIWGVYWAWDGRMTTQLLLALIYAGYLILRQSVNDPGQRAVVCAVVSIFGMVDIPIVYMANRWWRTQHPSPVLLGGQGSGLDPSMRIVLYFTFAAMLFLLAYLVKTRRRLEQTRREVEGLRRSVHAL
jgi:heme exporter protein C